MHVSLDEAAPAPAPGPARPPNAFAQEFNPEAAKLSRPKVGDPPRLPIHLAPLSSHPAPTLAPIKPASDDQSDGTRQGMLPPLARAPQQGLNASRFPFQQSGLTKK